jgi:methyltransferase-like protein
MSGAFMTPAVQNVLANTPLVQRCQLLDFLRNERFHKTLLCHREVALRRDWDVDTLKPFAVSLAQRPKAGHIDTSNADPVGIETAFGTMTVREPLGKAAMKHLIDVCPAAVSLDQLHDAAMALLPPAPARNPEIGSDSRTLLARSLLAALQAGLLKVYLYPPQFCGRVTERPLATGLARLLANRRSAVVSQLHENVVLDGLQAFLLPQLDGSRDLAALVEATRHATAAGRLTLPDGNRPVSESVETALAQLCGAYLLVG